MSDLATIVNGLGDFEAIVPIARDLAKRHAAHGAAGEHFRSGKRSRAVRFFVESSFATGAIPTVDGGRLIA